MIIPNVLKLEKPAKALPLIFDSPHSGTHYPQDFTPSCDLSRLEKAQDRYVDDLFSTVPDHGGTLLSALFARAYLDVNRARDDIDLELLSPKDRDNWPYTEDLPLKPTNRSYAGIGLIRRLVEPDQPLYNHNLSPKDIKSRIETYYDPYHQTLAEIINDAHYNFGQVWHINCHSMPVNNSRALANSAMARANPFIPPDFVLGDRDGTSCDSHFTRAVRDFLKSLGYKVAINDPYKGVELVERYSAPATGRHSLQIEISRALYLDEGTYKKSKNYNKLKDDITKLIQFCATYAQSNLTQLAAD